MNNFHASKFDLPIVEVLGDLLEKLESDTAVVLQAPPGAGKTTVVPLALLDQPWLQGSKIIMLEPRRLAAKNAAIRMAHALDEEVGETVGYRVRLESKVSKSTRIEVITEGILSRMLMDDPSLDGIGLVIFDEFHERSLEADLGLALFLNSRELFRNPVEGEQALKLLVMSATLDDARVAELIGDSKAAPIVRSEGKLFPVDIRYGESWSPGEDITLRVIKLASELASLESGSMLVFLPGRHEIRLVHEALSERLIGTKGTMVVPLYGDLTLSEQRQAIAPSGRGVRKIVLATSIAESSLTIDGVSVVIDAGLSRSAAFNPRTGMTHLETKRVSKASSVQRMGRAGRLGPGTCYRLWSETQQDQLNAFSMPEIIQADLAPLVLSCLNWGVRDPGELKWLDPPSNAQFSQAKGLLKLLGAVDASGSLTEHGKAMVMFPAHPRISHMLLVAKRFGLSDLAVKIAALLGEKDPLGRDESSDLSLRLSIFDNRHKGHQRIKKQRSDFHKMLQSFDDESVIELGDDLCEDYKLGFLLAKAYPDRIARRRRDNSDEYLLSNGRAAVLRSSDPLRKHEWLVASEVGGRKGKGKDQIYLAAPLDAGLLQSPLNELVKEEVLIEWDDTSDQFRSVREKKVGKLVISTEKILDLDPEVKVAALTSLVRKKGLDILPWTGELNNWRARVGVLREYDEGGWPDLSDLALLNNLETWLSPYLSPVNQIKDFKALNLKQILGALLPWPLSQKLDEKAPERISVPSGSSIKIDYSQRPPVLAVRLQEMFGCTETPRIADGKVTLMLHLLSPAQRPLAVTQDLASFWQNAYVDVKKDMKGRYPKHVWPDDPLNSAATSKTKKYQ